MRTVSLLLRKKPEEGFYKTDSFVEYLRSLDPGKIFLTVTEGDDQERRLDIMKDLLSDYRLESKIRDVSVTTDELNRIENEFNRSISDDASLIAKKKMLDMFTATIYSYLQGTWKDFESLNSPDTHTIFKARYLLISSVLPDYVSKYYFPLLHQVKDRINEYNPGPDDVVVADVEWSFWYRENVN